MRLLWVSNPPWVGSGYGEQTNLFAYRLAAQGHDMAGVCNFGLQGAVRDWDGMLWYPSDGQWGNLNTHTFREHHQAEGIIALCDAWVLQPEKWPPGPRWAVWAPVDHRPLPPNVHKTLEHPAVVPVAMSRFGERMMQDQGLDPVYVPHGIDTDLFRPRPDLKAQAREMLKIPDDVFLVGMVAANKGNPSLHRKSFPQAFDAFARFAKNRPDAWLYAHTEAIPTAGGGIMLDKLAEAMNVPQGQLRFPPDRHWHLGMSRNVVAMVYHAFDVLLSPSMGEGFGIPILEAQACGVPVIVSDHSAMTELGTCGWLVEGDQWWDPLQESFLHYAPPANILECLEAAYDHAGDQTRKDAAAAFAATYDADLIAPMWEPVIERLGEPIKPTNGGVTLNRKQRRKLEKAVR